MAEHPKAKEASTKFKIFLVDDHPLVREWLTALINQQEDLVVCGEAETAAQALELIATRQPDLAVVDLSLSGSSGLELIKQLRLSEPQVVILVLSMHEDALYAERALRAGARGYIVKRESTKKIVTAIRQVLAGKLAVSDELAAAMAEKFVGGQPTGSTSPVTVLSDRELEVFQLLGQGRESQEIAAELHVGLKTVQTYCERIKTKLNFSGITELRREAVRWEEQRRRV